MQFFDGTSLEGNEIQIESVFLILCFVHLQGIRLQLWKMEGHNKRKHWAHRDVAISWIFIGTFTTLNNPLDVVRFRMQVMPLLVEQGHLNKVYRNCLNCALRIHKYEGIKSFFKGNFSNLIRVVPTQTLVWTLKERLQRYFHYSQDLSQSQHIQYNTLIGITSGLIVAISLYPLQHIRQLLLNRTDRQGRSLWHYLRKTMVNQGITGIYRGVGLFSMGAILFRGVFFGIYDSLKVMTEKNRFRFGASCFASFCSIIAGYPFDTVRRRLITSRGKYQNGRQCFKDILRNQGVRGMYLGWRMIIPQSISMATTFFFYDKLITDYEQAMD